MLALPLLLAAAVAPYSAVGTEPFWSLRITSRAMRLEQPGRAPATVRAPVMRRSTAGVRYVAAGMVVRVQPGPCSDGMSDRTYPDSVTVTWRGRTLEGCGGAPVETVQVAGTSWTIVTVDGRPVDSAAAMVEFTGDRIAGNSGCNRFSGAYRIEGERLTVGALAGTRMVCPNPAMEIERRFLAIMAQPAAMTLRGDTLELSNDAGRVTLRKR